MGIARHDPSVIGQWWWQIDRVLLAIILALSLYGAIMVYASSPPVAAKLGRGENHFFYRHLFFLTLSLGGIFLVSFLDSKKIQLMCLGILLLSLVGLLLLPFLGTEVKGAVRWLRIGPIGFQPSEFMKPVFIIFVAKMLSKQGIDKNFPGLKISVGLFVLILFLLIMQPDIGQAALLSVIFMVQLFFYGYPLWIFVVLGFGGLLALLLVYFMLDHVRERIDLFLDPVSGDSYQITQSISAFSNGGWFGKGVGEGEVKFRLPDGHADFIFAVMGEEYGAVACIFFVIVFAIMFYRPLLRAMRVQDLFVALAVGGLCVQIGLQAGVNMFSTLALMPSKGMTLPLISYGGSSLLAISLALGIILALTRRTRA